ncbi:MAG: sigma-70 family RNA polymerase sigma factor [Planctomycetes bacterium]|nr:sigma-70 family RNA polymerase sigma factor [Planctomycetota bacterium]
MNEDRTRSLVEAASRGDAPAIDELIRRHLPRLRAYVRLRMGQALRLREGSMDVVQSVCRELIEHLDEFRYEGENQFLGWLFTTALNKVREKQRFHRRECRNPKQEAALDLSDAEDLAAIAHWLTPSRDAAGREKLVLLDRAFQDLPDEYREVIALARIVGLSHKEIAARMDRTEAAARKLLGRALARLGELLGDDGRVTA